MVHLEKERFFSFVSFLIVTSDSASNFIDEKCHYKTSLKTSLQNVVAASNPGRDFIEQFTPYT
jgi:hypothetical protein